MTWLVFIAGAVRGSLERRGRC
ncbi:unnamed protein product [Cuscuta epithymum]|uniref:Uncharacterized protein n=1 Tax=Cuscuta epithymum TaxID=186058 RepID=A0AAV0ELI3_9ASTE|nr:unnamed protein product [Cuscuta epithymum]